MSKEDIEREIRTRKSRTHSVGDQIKIAHAFWDAGINPAHDGVRTAEIVDRFDLSLEYNVGTSVRHLKDIDILGASFKSHNEWHPVAEWIGDEGEILFGDDLDEAVKSAVHALVDDMEGVSGTGDTPAVADGGATTVRRVVADEFDYDQSSIDEYLLNHDEDIETLNKAVQAIKESDEVSVGDDYGEVEFLPRAYYNRLTERAVNLYEK